MRFGCLAAAVATATIAVGSAAAQENAYLDDRSSPQALVRSLYNAIERKEYARAYGYFANPPAPTLEEYAAGFSGTESVSAVVGTPAQEGAAGSTFYTLPVAISTDGASPQAFAGCYTLRLADPQNQGAPFAPLAIEKSSLSQVDGPAEAALPASCADGPALPPQNPLLERARAKFLASRRDTCQVEEGNDPQVWDLEFHYTSDTADAPARRATLIRFYCSRGAYNETHVFYLANDPGDLRELHFAIPELDIRYEGDNTEGKVESMNAIGFNTVDGLVNPEFDEATRTITSWSKWRGIGDASSIGTWIFRDGDFALVKFDVDASYDGEIEHQTIIDYDTGP